MQKKIAMSVTLILLILCGISLSSIAQIVLRAGMSHPVVQSSLQSNDVFAMVKAISTSLGVLGGLSLYFASAAVWLFVLARIEVSVAYPFVGLGFILTMLLAHWIHGESLSATKVAGTFLITLGVALIAQR